MKNFSKLLLLALSLQIASNAIIQGALAQEKPAASPAPTAQPTAAEKKAAEEEETRLQKEQIVISDEELLELIKDYTPAYDSLATDKLIQDEILQPIREFKSPRDRFAAMYAAILLSDLRPQEPEADAPKNSEEEPLQASIPLSLNIAVLQTVTDLTKRSIKSPLGIGLAGCVEHVQEGDKVVSYIVCDIEELKTFFTAVTAAKGKKANEALPAIFKSVYDQQVAAEAAYYMQIGLPAPSESAVKEENTKIFTCVMGELMMDAPLFRKPCRRFKPYTDYIEEMKKMQAEAEAEAAADVANAGKDSEGAEDATASE